MEVGNAPCMLSSAEKWILCKSAEWLPDLNIKKICWNWTQNWLPCSHQDKHNLQCLKSFTLTSLFSLHLSIIIPMYHLSPYRHAIHPPAFKIDVSVSIQPNVTCKNISSKKILCISILRHLDTGVKLWCDLFPSPVIPKQYYLSRPNLTQLALTFSEEIYIYIFTSPLI